MEVDFKVRVTEEEEVGDRCKDVAVGLRQGSHCTAMNSLPSKQSRGSMVVQQVYCCPNGMVFFLDVCDDGDDVTCACGEFCQLKYFAGFESIYCIY